MNWFKNSHEITWIRISIFFVLMNLQKHFHQYIRTENLWYKILEIIQKIVWIVLNIIFSVFRNFSKNCCEYIRMEKNPNYKIENFEQKFLKIM